MDLVKLNKALSLKTDDFGFEAYLSRRKARNNNLLQALPNDFYYRFCWTGLIEKVFPRSMIYINIKMVNKGLLCIPAFAVRNIYFRKVLVSLPFTPMLRPLEYSQIKSVRKVSNFLIKSRYFYDFIFKINDYVKGDSYDYYLHFIELDHGNGVARQTVKSSILKSSLKLSRMGYSVAEYDFLTNLGSFYRLYRLNNKKHGSPSLPKEFFSELAISLKDKCVLYFCKKGTKYLSCSLFLLNGSEALYAYVGTDTSFSKTLDPGHKLIILNAMKQLKVKGMKSLNLGKTSLANKGLIRFKRSFGSKQVPLKYYSERSEGRSILNKNSFFRSAVMKLNKHAPIIIYDWLSSVQIKFLSTQ